MGRPTSAGRFPRSGCAWSSDRMSTPSELPACQCRDGNQAQGRRSVFRYRPTRNGSTPLNRSRPRTIEPDIKTVDPGIRDPCPRVTVTRRGADPSRSSLDPAAHRLHRAEPLPRPKSKRRRLVEQCSPSPRAWVAWSTRSHDRKEKATPAALAVPGKRHCAVRPQRGDLRLLGPQQRTDRRSPRSRPPPALPRRFQLCSISRMTS